MNPGLDSLPAFRVPALGRQPALDGIRGVAVLVVLGHNLGWKWLGGGFLGVDMFFALSGFLITTLLLEDFSRHGRVSLPTFFARRFLRLYPGLVVLVAFAVASVFVTRADVTFSRVACVAASVLGYWSNWYQLIDLQAWFGGMTHTWSLAIEMHFYLLWAVIVAAVTRWRGADLRTLVVVAVGLAAASALWRDCLWGINATYPRLYAGTDTRLDAVFLGSVAALLRLRHLAGHSGNPLAMSGRPRLWGAELFCLGLVFGAVDGCRQELPFAYFTGIPLVGIATSILILSTLLRQDSLAGRLFALPVLAWFGRISYSLYLWHVPVGKVLPAEMLVSHGLPSVAAEAVRAVVSIAVAAGSYYVVERPFLRLKVRFER